MGGNSSGRYRTRNRGAVEWTRRLDIRWLRKQGCLAPGALVSGSLTYGDASSIGFSIDLRDPDDGFADFTVVGEPRTQRIAIMASPCRFGGRRFYFWCTHSWRRCEVLCLVSGVFAARQAHRLNYASQSQDQLARLQRAQAKVEARVNGTDGRRGPARGRNRARLADRWDELETAIDEVFTIHVGRRFGFIL